MLNVTYKPLVLSAVMLGVVMLSDVVSNLPLLGKIS